MSTLRFRKAVPIQDEIPEVTEPGPREAAPAPMLSRGRPFSGTITQFADDKTLSKVEATDTTAQVMNKPQA